MEEIFGPLAFILVFFVLPRILRRLGKGGLKTARDKASEQRQEQMESQYEEKYGVEEQLTAREKAEAAREEELVLASEESSYPYSKEERSLSQQKVYKEENFMQESASSQGQMDPERDWSIDSESIWDEDWKKELAETKEEARKQIEKLQREIDEGLEQEEVLSSKVIYRPGMRLWFSPPAIIQGVIFSELLGRPRSRTGRTIRR